MVDALRLNGGGPMRYKWSGSASVGARAQPKFPRHGRGAVFRAIAAESRTTDRGEIYRERIGALENLRKRMAVQVDVQALHAEIRDLAAHGFQALLADQ